MNEGRYLRHSMIDWFDQARLKEMRVIVVGAGATGNEVLKNLTLLGLGHIHIIDFDLIEDHNLTRTILFTEQDTGKNKARAAAEACRLIDPSLDVTSDDRDLWSALTIEMLKRYDALFCCIDNYEGRIRLNELCLWAAVDFYNLGIDSRFVAAERFPFRSNPGCACYQCALPPSAYSRMRERYSCAWLRKKSWEEKKVPTTAITASLAGATACSLFMQKDHLFAPQGAVRLHFDTIGMTSTLSSLERNDECPCSSVLPDHHYVRVKNSPGDSPGDLDGLDGELPLFLSDRLILDVVCGKCGAVTVINDRAELYDDSLEMCPACEEKSNSVMIRDTLSVRELHERFRDRALPLKYFYFQRGQNQVIIELEEDHE